MKQLWAPWRMAYIHGPKEKGCIFCDKGKDGDLRTSLVLAETPHSLVMLNKYPYSNGHLLLAPRRHTNELSSLPAQEYWDLSQAFRKAVDVVSRALQPGGLNLGMNLGRCAGAGVEDHLHWHVVPRWEGDTNFMPVMDEVRVIPQHLLEVYDQLKPYFDDFSTEGESLRS
ncbi:MAG: HIT domain-containing protein [Deltaproteobacteria bacterium]|nr:HIT domain-containing protein [Deltaproteobacteria bacterium]